MGNTSHLESIVSKLETRKRELKFEVDQVQEELHTQRESSLEAEEKWKSRATVMARLEEQIKSISQVTMNKENELKKRLETSNKFLVAARQGEFELNERIKTFEADLVNMANYEQL